MLSTDSHHSLAEAEQPSRLAAFSLVLSLDERSQGLRSVSALSESPCESRHNLTSKRYIRRVKNHPRKGTELVTVQRGTVGIFRERVLTAAERRVVLEFAFERKAVSQSMVSECWTSHNSVN